MKIETYARTAALFLTIALLLGLYVRQNPTTSVGNWVYLPHCDTDNPNNRASVLQIAADGTLKFNQVEMDSRTFPYQLEEIYRSRDDKALFVVAASESSYQQFITTISRAKASIPNLKVFLIPPSLLRSPCGSVPAIPVRILK